MGHMVKNLPVMQETQIQSLGWENPLKKGLVTHSSILVWRIPWTEEPGGLQSTGSQRIGHERATIKDNMPLSLGDYFKLETIKASKTQKL